MSDQREKPWLFRTYAGHSTAKASNALYRGNLAKGQTGLSVAFDLPTQTGYDSDHELARGEVGKVGVPVAHLGDMRTLFDAIPLEEMNTSMTINATAPWLLALYAAVAEEQGADVTKLQGTVQNDIIKEYLSRGTYVCPPQPSSRMITDVAAWTREHMPKWNPMNVCSYHLQEAGATPEEELAFALATATAVLDDLKDQGPARALPRDVRPHLLLRERGHPLRDRDVQDARLRGALGRALRNPLRRSGPEVPPLPLRRAGELAGPHRTAARKQRLPHPDRDAGRDALQEGPRPRGATPRMERGPRPPPPVGPAVVLADAADPRLETDLLEYEDLFDGNPAVTAKVEALKDGARAELAQIDAMGGAVNAIEYMKMRLVESNAERIARIERGETVVVGVNRYQKGEASPLTSGPDAIMVADPEAEADQIARLKAWRAARDESAVRAALAALRDAARPARTSCPPPSPREGRRHHRRMGRRRARASSASTAPPPASPARPRTAPKGSTTSAPPSTPSPRASANGSASSSASPASTATRTAPNRSPPAPATAGWRSPTKASA